MPPTQDIDLSTPLGWKQAFWFPVQNRLARREVLIGGLLLLIPIVGWILNMGHRIEMTHRMQHGQPAWPAWTNYRQLWKDGCPTLLGMIEYHAPAVVVGFAGWYFQLVALQCLASVLWIVATMAVPGYMTHYCYARDPQEIFNPLRAMRRVWQAGPGYWHAWAIALAALALSFLGLLGLGIGFLWTSVWFWQVAGFSFATQFTEVFDLRGEEQMA
ncbi:DUF4013 domain-containing protein [Aeoliella mucimassa]|uniref:DUF4013 domain-containing protein n=1 Tax=Aeoliella mucimassa TaxID=2527972 RepID=A0A518AHI6_9BACT|nr:DUF4013 domain-containing protein [Aeoliella mucimassa]QDU54187.1 hypothetical protein Pan181_03670 [Aeoliella mucimassa]